MTYLLAALLAAGGVAHFARPALFRRMMPLWVPYHKFWVATSGVAELVLAVGLLLPATQNASAWATLAMFAVYLVVHVHMLLDPRGAGMGLPTWVLAGRVIAQFGLMAWAWGIAAG